MQLRLSCDRQEMWTLPTAQVIWHIVLRRMFIRYHRDQRGDNRCFLDDWLVWWFLSDTPPMPRYTGEQGMVLCDQFYRHRRSEDADIAPFGAVTDRDQWDYNLWTMSNVQLVMELYRIQAAIKTHRDITDRPRTADDDRALYAILPEQLVADFRLGSEEQFLGEERAPKAGCTAFWRSHRICTPSWCNLHRFGPCP